MGRNILGVFGGGNAKKEREGGEGYTSPHIFFDICGSTDSSHEFPNPALDWC